MKKLKIKGITGTPVFLTRWRGFIDAKRHAIAAEGGQWNSNYMQKVGCCYNTYIGGLYGDLEAQTFGGHKQSAELAVEYLDITTHLKAPDQQAGGKTASIQKRNAVRISAIKPGLQRRLTEVWTDLADIEEGIGRAVNEAEAIKRAAAAMTQRRIQAYLHGAALALQKPADTHFTAAQTFDPEADYRRRHVENDNTRKAILAKIAKEVAGNEAVS